VNRPYLMIFLILIAVWLGSEVFAQESSTVENDSIKAELSVEKENTSKSKKTPKEPKFEEVVEGFEKIEGLFTLYQDLEEGQVYMEIRQDQFGEIFLCNITRESGDASLFDSGAMLNEFPFFIEQVGKRIQFIQKNILFRAKSDAAIHKAIEHNISNSLWGSTKIASQPHPDRGSILIDPSDIFLMDFNLVGHLSSQAKSSYSFDRSNSYFSELKSFPMNSEIEVTLHFKSSSPNPVFTLMDSRSMMHRYHYSISTLPETDYQSRTADDRIGHFWTIYQDYSSVLEDTPYKRFINRWHLEKSEPKFDISNPKKPIVFWLENTIPVEYRDAVKEGVLLWNKAFEKIGFRDAIVVKEMPDDADWDPADVRYSTIRWIVQPEGRYAVGPSRANPFTGQIYDADVRISADLLRATYIKYEEFTNPLSWTGLLPGMKFDYEIEEKQPNTYSTGDYFCNLQELAAHQLAFGWNILSSRGLVKEEGEDLKNYIKNFLIYLVAHEIGHTLGLRHNLKASSTVDNEKLNDPEYAQASGISGSVMDYNPVNISPEGKTNGSYFQTTLGPYDYWAIEYAYLPYNPDSKQSEKEMLEKIAQKSADPKLQYGTDEDFLGFTTRGIDPKTNYMDLGADPITYYENRTDLAKEIWKTIPEKFNQKGERFQKYRTVFSQAINEYAYAALTVPKFVGGIYSHRDHIGDPNGRPPFEVVPAETQRRALNFIKERFFAQNAFNFSPDLLNRLAPERFWDFEMMVMRVLRIDYPIHGIVQLLQSQAMFKLFDPLVLQRIQDNELRLSDKSKTFKMPELFETVREAVWEELNTGENINSFRRELQRIHLYVLNSIFVLSPRILPHDAISLTRADLVIIKNKINQALSNNNLDAYTRAHLVETEANIESILKAQVLKVG
jgi:hypothetical protein